ncbi:MAG: ABC transporter permease [Anaerolineales bacterium]
MKAVDARSLFPTLLLANARMALRSRGVIFAVFASTLQIAVFGLLPDLDFKLGSEQINFFDFALPGMAIFLVVYQLQDITVAVAAGYRARGILKRLAVTPVSPAAVILTQAFTYVWVGLAAAVWVLAIGKMIGGNVVLSANLLWVLPLMAMVLLTSLAIAFAIAGLTSNPQTASNVGTTVTFFLFALTGAMLPIEVLPEPLPVLVPYAVPHAALIQAIRGITLTGAGITNYSQQVLLGGAWLLVAFVAAALAYRFEEE